MVRRDELLLCVLVKEPIVLGVVSNPGPTLCLILLCVYIHHIHRTRVPHSPPLPAMIRALKALQDKIRTLELERSAAADKFRHLAEETQRQGRLAERATQVDTPHHTSHSSPPTYSPTPSQDQEGTCTRIVLVHACGQSLTLREYKRHFCFWGESWSHVLVSDTCTFTPSAVWL